MTTVIECHPPGVAKRLSPDFNAVKAKQQAAWSSGDYAVIGTTLQIVGEALCEAVDLRSNQRVLDVAAGNGNATLAAARRFADVVSTDYVTALLDRGRQRARAEGLDVLFQQADAEALPFPDASFDVVLSTFGVMFTPKQEQAARELIRVCRDRPSKLDAGELHRPAVQDHRQVRATRTRREVAGAVGQRGTPRHPVRFERDDRGGAQDVRLSLQVSSALGGDLSRLLRSCSQGILGDRPAGTRSARGRSLCAHRPLQRRRGWHPGGAR
jgi:SAM-dependent methyltransferase